MLNTRLNAARKVASSLFDAEKDIDSAVTRTLGLITAMLEARAEAKLPTEYGQGALDSLGGAVTALIASRRQMVEAHRELAVVQDQIGLRTKSFGDEFPKQPPEPEGRATLRSVA